MSDNEEELKRSRQQTFSNQDKGNETTPKSDSTNQNPTKDQFDFDQLIIFFKAFLRTKIGLITVGTIALIILYYVMSPYQNCIKYYFPKWCVANTSW